MSSKFKENHYLLLTTGSCSSRRHGANNSSRALTLCGKLPPPAAGGSPTIRPIRHVRQALNTSPDVASHATSPDVARRAAHVERMHFFGRSETV